MTTESSSNTQTQVPAGLLQGLDGMHPLNLRVLEERLVRVQQYCEVSGCHPLIVIPDGGYKEFDLDGDSTSAAISHAHKVHGSHPDVSLFRPTVRLKPPG